MWVATQLRQAERQLENSENARLDAELLLCSVLGCERSRLYAHPEQRLDEWQLVAFADLLARRAEGCPVAYLIGRKAFWSLELQVTSDTLIPRPETELLIETALALIPARQSCSVLDLGTGTGAIALAIARERPACHIIAVDNSAAALTIAEKNGLGQGIRNVRFIKADWFAFRQDCHYDLIVSNPPYIGIGDPCLQQGDVRYEPEIALVAGQDGLDAIRTIVSEAMPHMKPAAWLLFEHGYRQGGAVRKLLVRSKFTAVSTRRDHASHERMSMGQCP